jgi:hypothetical protein
VIALAGACRGGAGEPTTPPAHPAAGAAESPPPAPDAGSTLGSLRREARALEPLVTSELGKRFLRATALLPPVGPRAVYHDAERQSYYTEAERAALPPAAQAPLALERGADDLYYETHYGSPLAYARAVDLAAQAGFAIERRSDAPRPRVLDFGYGGIGQLRLLAALGADAVGVDVDPFLRALYAAPSDQGSFPELEKTGTVTLVHGRFPADAAVRARVGAGYDLVLSKNTLKNGYIHPERPVGPRQRFDLGVDEGAFVAALRAVTKPGGLFVLYNISPPPAPPDGKYLPHADGRCPFARASLEGQGFEVLAFDHDDSAAMRALAKAMGWDVEMKIDLEKELFALYTLARARR